MSEVVESLSKLEEQLREDGYKGTHRAMRLLKTLRSSLEGSGYFFQQPERPVKERSIKSEESFSDALDSLV
jgi:hypothetical protein